MSKQFGDLSYANISPQYVGQDIEGIKAVDKAKRDVIEGNIAQMDKMDILRNELYSQVDKSDAVHITNAIDKANNDLKNIKESGNYDVAASLINKTVKDLAMDSNVSGAINKQKQKTAKIQDIQSRIGLPLDKNGITQEQANESIRMINNNLVNNSTIEFDPETHSYKNSFQGYDPVKYIDRGEMVNKFLKDAKADTKYINDGGVQVPGYYSVVSKEYVPYEKLLEDGKAYLKQNSEVEAYTNEELMFQREKTKDSQGNYKQITLNDLANVGITQDLINKEAIKRKEIPVDLNTLTLQEKEQEYYNAIKEHKYLESVAPSADKYSYEKLKGTFMKNISYALSENYKYKNAGKVDDRNLITQTDYLPKENNQFAVDSHKGTPLEGIEYNQDGSQKPFMKSEIVPFTQKEINQIYKDYNTTPDEVGNAAIMAASKINAGKQVNNVEDKERTKAAYDYTDKMRQDNPILDEIPVTNPDGSQATDKTGNPLFRKATRLEVNNMIAEANQSNTQISDKVYPLTSIDSKEFSKKLLSNLQGKDIMIDGKFSNDLKSSMEALGITEKGIPKIESVEVAPGREGAYVIKSIDKSGNPHIVTINSSPEFKQYFKVATKATNFAKVGKTGKSEPFWEQDPIKIKNNNGIANNNTYSQFQTDTKIVQGEKGKQYNTTINLISSPKQVENEAKSKNIKLKDYLIDYNLRSDGNYELKEPVQAGDFYKLSVNSATDKKSRLFSDRETYKPKEYNSEQSTQIEGEIINDEQPITE